MELRGPSKNKRRKDSAVQDEHEDLVSLCGSVATTEAGDESLLDFELDEERLAVETDCEFERKFFVMKEGSFPGKIYAFPHPASGDRALYLLNERGEVFELLQLDNGKRSFFFGDSVVGKGSVLMFFPVHPLFLAIGHFQRKASDCFMTVAEILEDDDYPSFKELSLSAKLMDALKTVADFEIGPTTKNEDPIKFRYNEGRLLIWLSDRFRILKDSLAANCDETDDDQCFGILADYLPEAMARRLKERLDIKSDRRKGDTQHKNKRAFAESGKEKEAKSGLMAKRVNFDRNDNGRQTSELTLFGGMPKYLNLFMEGSVRSKEKTTTKLFAEASKGSRPIASFFGTTKANKNEFAAN